ncbi:MAG: ATP-binding cassette domain-containing protein [Gammaproteobacteria bacterium]|nr:ATP-binding cassette domain-containing protein [Gammaproteobacteria bacterium]
MIELHQLYKSYAKHTVLQDINLLVQEGEIFGIIGRSGAGKSTLLRCINALESPDRGQVLVDQQDISQLRGKALQKARHKTAMVFQQFNLLQTKTVYDNIALPMRIQGISDSQIDSKINELLPLVELGDKAQAYPNQLSGGQKQRVAIARALSCSPKILLCDEATSALDPETTHAILNLLHKINTLYGITLVLITHEMDVIKQICHRVAIMETGKIIETTDLASVLSQKNSLARKMLYSQLSPQLPTCLQRDLTNELNGRPLLRLLFEGETTAGPFISQISRELNIDINILQANVDRFNGVTCGVLIVELHADEHHLQPFMQRCQHENLSVEVLGYVHNNHVI